MLPLSAPSDRQLLTPGVPPPPPATAEQAAERRRAGGPMKRDSLPPTIDRPGV